MENVSYHSYECVYRELVRIRKPKYILEWGPGLNTSIALDAGSEVITIEHNPIWLYPNYHKNLVQMLVPLNHKIYPKPLENFKAFDLFFVDGRRRAECLQNIYSECNLNALICLHDAQREKYQEAIKWWPYVRFYESEGLAVMGKEDVRWITYVRFN